MDAQGPVTRRMNVRRTRQELSQLLNQVYRQETRVGVEKSGIPVAAIVSVRDLGRINALEREQSEDFRALDRIGEAFAEVNPEELEAEVGRALERVRQRGTREAPGPRAE
jgi:prevent-host-death family protein